MVLFYLNKKFSKLTIQSYTKNYRELTLYKKLLDHYWTFKKGLLYRIKQMSLKHILALKIQEQWLSFSYDPDQIREFKDSDK